MPHARTRPRGAVGAVLCVCVCLAAPACGGGDGTPADGGRPPTGGSAGGGRGGSGGAGAGGGGAGGAGGSVGGSGGAGGASAADAAAGAGGSGGSPPADAAGGAGTGGTAPPADAATVPDSASACGVCTSWGEPQLLGRIQVAALNAVSGIAASWRNPGVLYVHNDRDRPEFHAFSEAVMPLGRFTMGGATVRDIEDIAVSRCPGGTCVFLADLGNNVSPRTEFVIYRATEPAIDPARPGGDATLPAERFAFSYADSPHNAESLLVEAATGAVYVITKEAAGVASAAYKLESFEVGRANRAVRVADLPVPAAGDQPATAGAAHPCGGGLLLRTGNRLYEFRTPAGSALADALRVTPAMVPVGNEMQGEAVSYRADGRAYYTTSEGANPPIHRVVCR